jgi:hypothetical protein
MTDTILFKEQQRFNQIWLWVLLIGTDVTIIAGILSSFLVKRLDGSHPPSFWSLFIPGLILLFVNIGLGITRLETLIKKDGIYIRFYPFHRKYITYQWSNISECFVRTYKPIFEYGGWGLRIGLFGKGGAFSTSGNKGIQLVSKNKSRMLIGTHKPDEIAEILTQLGYKNDHT